MHTEAHGLSAAVRRGDKLTACQPPAPGALKRLTITPQRGIAPRPPAQSVP